jgi:hypothetical protein
MRQNAVLLTQHVSSISMPIFRSTIVSTAFWGPNREAVWAVQHTQLTAQRYRQVWTPESGTHYCTPEDGHTNARNMLSQ